MTPDEVATVLAKAAAYDRRTVGRSDVAAWQEALYGITLDEALAAVALHYRASTKWLTPADVVDRARDIRADRRRRDRTRTPALALPSRFEDDADRAQRIARGVAACRAAITRPEPEKAS